MTFNFFIRELPKAAAAALGFAECRTLDASLDLLENK